MIVGPVSQESNAHTGARAAAGPDISCSVSGRAHAQALTPAVIGFRFAVCTKLSK